MKDIDGYEGLYAATEDGKIFSYQKNDILTISTKRGGYLNVRLCRDGIQEPCKVHRLIAKTFIPNPERKKDVNHKNGIKYDNRVENLEWCTRSENIKHSFRVLNRKRVSGVDHIKSKTVLDLRTGIYYPCVAEASHARQLTRHQIKSGIRLHGLYEDLVYA